MGMYDELRCRYPLPVKDAAELVFQTKSLDCTLDLYEITEDGRLRHEIYDTEDRSDPNAEGLERIFGMATRVNQRWEDVADFTGEVRFYTFAIDLKRKPGEPRPPSEGWLEFSSYFTAGRLQVLNLIVHTPPEMNLTTQKDS